jgi:tetratricopeptide (TPR) repeat protein
MVAKQRARQALNIDPENWRASSLLASKISPRDGIATIKPVIDRLRSDDEWHQCYLNRSGYSTMFFILAEKTYKLSPKQFDATIFDATIGFAKSAIRIEPTDYPRNMRFLQLCADHKQWLLYVELLETIADSSNALEEHALSELMILCIFDMNKTEQLPLMLHAALYTDRLEFIVEAFRDCVEKLEARGDRARLCFVRYYYGRGLNALQNGSPKAIEQWRKAIEEGAGPDLLSSLISNIAPYYLQKAIKAAAAHDDEAASINLEKIQTLLPEDVPESSVMLPPAIYIVRYHARKGDLLQTKLIARDIVRKGIEILTDDIEDNDLPAYNELLWLFIALGDEENVTAIRSLIVARFREHRNFTCEGDCGGSWGMADEMIWCQDCINVKFENGCHGKLHETGFPFLFCNSTHNFLHLPKVDSPQDGHVSIGDDVIPVDEWMQHIQRDYIELVR